MKPKDAAKKLGVSVKHVNKVKEMIDSSMHKRSPPAIAYLKPT